MGSRPLYSPSGRQLAAGERPRTQHGELIADPLPPAGDRKLTDVGPRPCSSCRRKFQPTIKRRRLCFDCFRRASRHGDAGVYEPHDDSAPGLP